MFMRTIIMGVFLSLISTAQSEAGQRSVDQATFEQETLPTPAPGQTATLAVGQVGQRQTRERPIEGIEPMARITSRIQNRAQTRIRNRIDRYYDPQANATSLFAVAGEQARTAGRRRR